MNRYEIDSPNVMTQGYPSTPAANHATSTSVLGMADQVNAAVQDVVEAWRYFRDGPQAEVMKSAQTQGQPLSGDRLNIASEYLNASVNALAELAREIRSRA